MMRRQLLAALSTLVGRSRFVFCVVWLWIQSSRFGDVQLSSCARCLSHRFLVRDEADLIHSAYPRARATRPKLTLVMFCLFLCIVSSSHFIERLWGAVARRALRDASFSLPVRSWDRWRPEAVPERYRAQSANSATSARAPWGRSLAAPTDLALRVRACERRVLGSCGLWRVCAE